MESSNSFRREETRLYQQTLWRALFIPLAAIAVLTLLLLWQVIALLSAARWVAHTDAVIAQARLTLQIAVDMETGQRGYLVSGEAGFLEPYRRAERGITPAFDRLTAYVADNPGQQNRTRDLLQTFRRWETLARNEIAQHGRDPVLVRATFREGAGKATMDEFRRQVAEFIREEERLRTKRNEAFQSAAGRTLAAGLLLLPAAGGLLFASTRRQMRALTTQYREMAAAEERAIREAEAKQRRFVREVLSSVTEGRLRFCESDADLPSPLPEAGPEIALSRQTLCALRALTQDAAARCRLPDVRGFDLVLASGEAAMNAVVHAGGGEGRVCADAKAGQVQVWIRDAGKGIAEDALHRATLERGYSSAGTLGHGFWVIIQTVDRVYLLTGSEGTTVVLEQGRAIPDLVWPA